MHAQMHPTWFCGPGYFQLTEAHPKSTSVSMSGVSCHSCSEGTGRPRTDLTSGHQDKRRKGNLSLCCVPGHPSSCPIELWDHSFLGLFSPQGRMCCCPPRPSHCSSLVSVSVLPQSLALLPPPFLHLHLNWRADLDMPCA